MKKIFNGLASLISLLVLLGTVLMVGIGINIVTQMGAVNYEKGQAGLETLDLMGGTLVCFKGPLYENGHVAALYGGLVAGFVFLFIATWLSCLVGRPRDENWFLTRKFEYVFWTVGLAQIFYGFGRLALMKFPSLFLTPTELSFLTLIFGLLIALLVVNRETLTSLLKVKELETKPSQVVKKEETIIDIIKKLYDEGKTEEILEKTEGMVDPEIHGLRAWVYYRQKEFEKAREEAKKGGNNETCLRCLAAIAAYYDKDSALMKHYTDQLPETPGRDNTFMIYAREPDDKTSREEILAKALKWLQQPIKDRQNTANLLNNTGRWFLAKGKTKEDLIMALGFLQSAIALYGTWNDNLHHRASAWYWTSIIQEQLLDRKAAINAMEVSVNLWEKQIKVDPSNPNFQKSLEGAKNRLTELLGKSD